MRQWNQGQQQAIETKEKNVLVMASAGTGKTAVLVERVVRQLIDDQPPLSIEQVLLVTFTNAAAHEMRERISQALTERLEGDPDNQWIQRQLLLLNNAAISTLHAFCLDLIRKNYDLIGIDPQSRILNEAEQLLWKQQVLEEILERNYEAEEPGFVSLISRFSGEKNDEPLRELINKVYDMAISQPYPESWLNDAIALFADFKKMPEDLSEEEIKKKLVFLPVYQEQIRQRLASIIELLENACECAAKFPALKKYLPIIQEEADNIRKYLKAKTWQELQNLINANNEVFSTLPKIGKKCIDEETTLENDMRVKCQDEVKNLRDQAKKDFNNLRSSLQGMSLLQITADIRNIADAVLYLAKLVKDYMKEYQVLKKEKGAMDFNDIEHWALALLIDAEGRPTDLCRALNERFKEVLVDEYQDINPMQEELLQALAQGGRFFMVGDIKQSIYGFRQAEPKLFLNKFEEFTKFNTGQVIRLTDNYRSSQWIIKGINQIFDILMNRKNSGLDYKQDGRFICGSPRPDRDEEKRLLELHVIDKENGSSTVVLPEDTEEETAGEETEELEALEEEAWLAGRRILDLMQEQVWDSKEKRMRETRYRDIVILLPVMQRVAPVFVEVLQKLGIPVYADMGSGYFGAQEIQTVISFLKVVENPRQDIPLAALLLSPAIGFSPDDLAQIRLVKKEGDLYESLVLCARKGPQELRRPIRDFLKELKIYRRQALEDSLENLLLTFYEKTGFLIIAGAMPGGTQRQANLRAMVQRARQFEESNTKGIYAFLKYLEGLEKNESDLSPAAIIGEKDDVVRIMTIHRSKGLEFPVVLICNVGRQFNRKDLQQEVLLHRIYGFGPSAVDPEKRFKYSTAIQQTIRQALLEESQAEQLRLLYVAMTRAKDKLIIVGRMAKAREKTEIYQYFSRKDPGQAACFLDWLLMAACSLPQEETEWQLRIWSQEEIGRLVGTESAIAPLWKILLADPVSQEESRQWEKLGKRFEWHYQYQDVCGLPGKRSVSQVKGRLYPELDEDAVSLFDYRQQDYYSKLNEQEYKPKFLQQQESNILSGRERGNLLHKILALIDFTCPWSEDNLADQINCWLDDLVAKEYLNEQERELVPAEPLIAFLQSPLARRMMAAGSSVKQEASFTMLVPASRIYTETSLEDEVVLQGTVDAYFVENGEIVLIDYKTDRLRPGQEEDFIRRYQGQLKVYAEALTTATGMAIKEQWLYSLALNTAFLVNAE